MQPKYSSNAGINQKCSISEYTCANNNCISAAQFCDNNDDCGDGSDEPRFCTSEYRNLTNVSLIEIKQPASAFPTNSHRDESYLHETEHETSKALS